jgi:hypothetical protein
MKQNLHHLATDPAQCLDEQRRAHEPSDDFQIA